MANSSSSAEVRSVLLPLNNGTLLLPNASVAEVISYQVPEALEGDKPDWMLGTISWRQQRVPLVCFDRLAGQSGADAGHRARIAISNTLNGNAERPFIAILLHSAPHLVRITESVITPVDMQRDLGEVVKQQVIVGGEEVWVPNLDVLEWLVSEQL